MRLKWFWVAFLCVTLLHSALVVRAQHEDYPEEEGEEDKNVAGSEDMIEVGENAEEVAPSEPADDPPPPEEEPQVEEVQEQPETEEVQVEALEPNQDDVTDVDVGVQPKIGARKSGNYYFDEDYYSGNYDVDLNYDWSKYTGTGRNCTDIVNLAETGRIHIRFKKL